MSQNSPLPGSSPLPSSSPARSSPTPPSSTQPRKRIRYFKTKTPQPPPPPPVKKALTFDFSSTAVVSGLPPAEKAQVLLEYYQRYMRGGHPDSPVAPGDDAEKKARSAATYELVTQYFRTKYREAQEAAESADCKDDGPYSDSSDEEEFVPPPPVFWFGGHPYKPEEEDLSVAQSAAAVVELIDQNFADDLAKGDESVRGAWASSGLPPLFSFIASSSGVGAVNGEPIERAWAESAPPLERGERSMPVARALTATLVSYNVSATAPHAPIAPQAPTAPHATTAVPDDVANASGGPTAATVSAADVAVTPSPGLNNKKTSAAPAPGAPGPSFTSAPAVDSGPHGLRLVSVFGWRDVRCACTDGKHGDHTRKEECAFPAHDGTLVVRTMRTEVIPLN
ncbi:hypothetical protein R3P38DRAFT_3202001 [Favolaschia claudopus]|uniref:Uncharacterized protein n=1 Tax=Favolaschia claudopus TaxID=2862362 RepID=A0AAW0AXM2_9AGAR